MLAYSKHSTRKDRLANEQMSLKNIFSVLGVLGVFDHHFMRVPPLIQTGARLSAYLAMGKDSHTLHFTAIG